MSSFLYELGRTAFRRRKTFAAAWLVILVLLGGFVAAFKNDFSDSFTLPGSESQEAQDSLKLTFPQASGAAGSIIVVAPEGQKVTDRQFRSAIGDAVDRVDDFDHVESATSPFSKRVKGGVSEGDRAAIINISYDDDYQALPETVKSDLLTEVDHMKQELPNGTQVAPGGDIFKVTGMHVSWVEGLGVAIAFVVLLFTFGSALAAGIPLVTAILGVMLGLMLIVASTAFADVSSTAPMLALMLGLAVGIDYALFIISRARSLLRDGLEPEEAVARALATAGSAVVFAGMTVIIALVGLMVCRMPFLTVMGFGAAGTVAVAVLVALTLVPALMGMLGKRLIPRSVRRARARAEARGEAEPARASGAEPVAGPGA
ncbi:MMPL family transporter, partial [Brevibacterium sp. 5221]